MNDLVNHPPHYAKHPSGIECIEITELLPFTLGNAFKYAWRAGNKFDTVEDWRKARWYLTRLEENLPDYLYNAMFNPPTSLVAVIDRDVIRVVQHEEDNTKRLIMYHISAAFTEYNKLFEHVERAIELIEEKLNELGYAPDEEKTDKQADWVSIVQASSQN